MSNIHTIIKAVGRRTIADALQVSVDAVDKAKERGSFPAPWYLGIRDLCAKRAIPLRDEDFNMRVPQISGDS